MPEGHAQPDTKPLAHEPRLMSFGDHLDELRTRVFWALVGPLPIFVVCLIFGSKLLEWMTAPLLAALTRAGEASHLIATSPTEGFTSYMKVAAVVTLVVGLPWILYQLWLFVAPGLYSRERRFIYFLFPLSAFMTTAGLAFLYWVLLPLSLVFLIEFGAGLVTPTITTVEPPAGTVFPQAPVLQGDPASPLPGQMWINQPLDQLRIRIGEGDAARTMALNLHSGAGISQEYRLSEYVDLVFMLGLAFAVAFQLPIVLMVLSWTGLLEARMLVKYRKQCLFGAVVLAALLPTQDPASLVVLTVVMYGLYEFGVLLMRAMPARRVAGGWWRSAPAPEGESREEGTTPALPPGGAESTRRARTDGDLDDES
ncbi:MAG: twin-arginine translocase subunit TatC [Phycisphaerales bacterium]